MADIPHAVLSENFEERLKGRRVRSAVFLTYRFEPGFFEQDVLPAVLPDVALSHVPVLRLAELERVLREGVDQIAVYYDIGGLVTNSESAKLDVRRIPIAYPTGRFHPKNVFLLVEERQAGPDGKRQQSLVFATLSANLTRRGWWENVEACHIDEIAEGSVSSLRDDILLLIRRVRAAAPPGTDHVALDTIRDFVRGVTRRQQRSFNGVIFPRLYSGGESVREFLRGVAGNQLRDLHLEVISPYFNTDDVEPLIELYKEFVPREIRVFLPRGDDGSALCPEDVYRAANVTLDFRWGALPAELLRSGKNEQAKRRTVHAKVYRFFHPHRRYEALFVGSVNLTTSAHFRGGNFETGMFIETEPKSVPSWWLSVDAKKPLAFLGNDEQEDGDSRISPLAVRYDWGHERAEVFWDAPDCSGALHVAAQGAPLCELSKLAPREWQRLGRAVAERLSDVLRSTSFLSVSEDGGPPATILVQEEGMAHKPSLIKSLSVSEILEYWSLLTPEQKSAFLEAHIDLPPEALVQIGIDRRALGKMRASMFDTFAGIYNSFQHVERAVLDSIDQKRPNEAEYRLFGKKYDSLPSLLTRLLKEEKDDDEARMASTLSAQPTDGAPVPDSGAKEMQELDLVSRYVIIMCTKQLVSAIESRAPAFCEKHRGRLRDLKRQIARGEGLKESFTFGEPGERSHFLEWFESWFLKRAEPLAEVVS